MTKRSFLIHPTALAQKDIEKGDEEALIMSNGIYKSKTISYVIKIDSYYLKRKTKKKLKAGNLTRK